MNKEVCPPLYYAIGAFCVTPVTALLCVLSGIILILCWPFIPFLCYFQRKEELKKINLKTETTKLDTNNEE